MVLIDPLVFEKPSTRSLVKYFEGIGAEGKVLLLTHELNGTVVLSARNVPEVLVRPFGGESTYDILWSTTVVIERSAVDALGGESSAESVGDVEPDTDSAAEALSTEGEETNDA